MVVGLPLQQVIKTVMVESSISFDESAVSELSYDASASPSPEQDIYSVEREFRFRPSAIHFSSHQQNVFGIILGRIPAAGWMRSHVVVVQYVRSTSW